jgi:hypothetical protein
MCLNLEKCTFGDTILKMETSSSKEWVMKLNGMLTPLNRFLSRSAQHTLPFYKLLRKEVAFEVSGAREFD